MALQSLIIRTCRHILTDGRRCQGAAIRGRACCRHHLDARIRLHNMACARRLACVPRLRVPETLRDLALNRAEVLRVVNSGSVDFATARLMLWAMDLSAAALPVAAAPCLGTNKPNVFSYVHTTLLFQRNYTENPSQVSENTWGRGGGGATHSRLGPGGPTERSPALQRWVHPRFEPESRRDGR
jgi:hypothetical protein